MEKEIDEMIQEDELHFAEDNEEDADNLLDFEADLKKQSDPEDQFVQNLKHSGNLLSVKSWDGPITMENAEEAIELLPKKNKQFSLPVRISLGISIEDSNPTSNIPELKVYLDKPIGN